MKNVAEPVSGHVEPENNRAVLVQALADATKAENSNARRMRNAIVEARRQLAKGRALWNGPCIQCDRVLEQALHADNSGSMGNPKHTQEEIDAYLNTILKAAGSALRHYDFKDGLRKAMREVLEKAGAK